jgi:hypothetical protein
MLKDRKTATGIVKGRRGRQTYEIPVDHDGFVPIWALIERFQAVGDIRKDQRDNKPILNVKFTPEEIIEWWHDPSSCDLAGIDDRDAAIYSVPRSIIGKKRRALECVAIISDQEESDRIKKILAKRFSAEELESMTKGRSFFIKDVPRLRDCTGFYMRRQEDISVANITLERGTTEDGIVHEVVHHLRVVEGRATFPTDKKGVFNNKKFRALPADKRDKLVVEEERETVFETVVRTETDPSPSGYYDTIPGKSSEAAYLHDRKLAGKPKVGKPAKKASKKYYYETDISDALILNNRRGKK